MPLYSPYSAVASATTLIAARPQPQPHIYFHVPTTIFRARVNMPGTINYPVTSLIFDTVTTGVFGDLQADQTLILGSAPGLDDLGRARVQNLATSTQIPVGRVSQGVEDGTLQIQDNAYISALEDFRVWAKLPYVAIDPDPSAEVDEDALNFKDSDILVGDYMTQIPPVSNCGSGFADYIDPDTGLITVTLPEGGIDLSYAMADGATIVSHNWDVKDGTITVGTNTSPVITATFPAGFRVVAHSAEDSNGKGHTSRVPVLAVDPDDDVTIDNSKVQLTQRLTQNGQTLDVNLAADLPRTSWPDGCLVMLWWDAPASPSDRSHMKFVGWLQSESWAIRATKPGLVRETVLHCVDVAGRLDTLPGFPQALERNSSAQNWSYMPGLTINKALHYLLHWHSTALAVADFFLPDDDYDYPAMRIDTAGSSLYDQVNSTAIKIDPDHILTCNSRGQLRVMLDWMLIDVGDRPAASPILTEDDYTELSSDYNRPPRVHVLRNSAVVSSTGWLVIGGQDTLPLAFSIAPGDAFSQGTSEQTEAEGLTLSQALLNKTTGHKYARLNARVGQARLKLPNADIWEVEPALMQRIQLNIAAEVAAQRGLPFTQTNIQVKELSVRYVTDKKGTYIDADLSVEFETSGYPAQTVVPPDTAPPDDYETPAPELPTTPPDLGLRAGVEEVAGIGIGGMVYRTADFQTPSGSGGPTWDEVDLAVGDLYSFVVDPFSPGYIAGSGTVDGWVANDTGIYRVADLFGSPVATSVFTFAVAADMGSYHWRSIQASFGAYFAEGSNPWLLCVSYYGSTGGHSGTWATYSVDGGATWAAEVQVSEFYGPAQTRFNPIGVYASPKTPGLAYTAAYIDSETTPLADGYVSHDWGATWARLTLADDPATPLAAFDVVADNVSPPSAGVLAASASRSYVVGQSGTELYTHRIFVMPPANAVRVVVSHVGIIIPDITGGAAYSSSYDLHYPTFVLTSQTIDDAEIEFTRHASRTEWPGNREQAGDVGMDDDDFLYFEIHAHAVWAGGGEARVTLSSAARIVEIELEDGTIYAPPSGMIQPGDAQSGSIHLPWESNPAETIAYSGNYSGAGNREFRLYASESGAITDISPSSGGRFFGPNKFGFSIRAHDSARQYLLLAGIGNDGSADADDDKHAIFASDDYGATWATIVAPVADSEAPAGRPAFEAAFGGDSEQVIFIWGLPEYMSYSADFGSSIGDRSGNLGALGASAFCGIAGGPSA